MLTGVFSICLQRAADDCLRRIIVAVSGTQEKKRMLRQNLHKCIKKQ